MSPSIATAAAPAVPRRALPTNESVSAQHPDLPLSFAWQMRNVLAHGYFKVDLALVWQTVQRDLPALRQGVQAALDAGGGDADPIANA